MLTGAACHHELGPASMDGLPSWVGTRCQGTGVPLGLGDVSSYHGPVVSWFWMCYLGRGPLVMSISGDITGYITAGNDITGSPVISGESAIMGAGGVI